MRERILLAVDTSNQVYKASAAHMTLSSEERFTGGLYGFIYAVQKAITACEATDIVLCMDTKPYHRSIPYPEYKSLRKDTADPELAENARETMPYIRHMAEVLGWPVWSLKGFESDDLIAYCNTQHRHRYAKIYAMSNDSDLFQLFKYSQFHVYKGTKGIYGRADFDKEFNFTNPSDIPRLLALTGTHNEVEGIYGIGPVNARKIVGDPAQYRNIRIKHADLIDRNIDLITLPHKLFPLDTPIPKISKKFNERAFVRFCGQYDINITQAACEAFGSLRFE